MGLWMSGNGNASQLQTRVTNNAVFAPSRRRASDEKADRVRIRPRNQRQKREKATLLGFSKREQRLILDEVSVSFF